MVKKDTVISAPNKGKMQKLSAEQLVNIIGVNGQLLAGVKEEDVYGEAAQNYKLHIAYAVEILQEKYGTDPRVIEYLQALNNIAPKSAHDMGHPHIFVAVFCLGDRPPASIVNALATLLNTSPQSIAKLPSLDPPKLTGASFKKDSPANVRATIHSTAGTLADKMGKRTRNKISAEKVENILRALHERATEKSYIFNGSPVPLNNAISTRQIKDKIRYEADLLLVGTLIDIYTYCSKKDVGFTDENIIAGLEIANAAALARSEAEKGQRR